MESRLLPRVPISKDVPNCDVAFKEDFNQCPALIPKSNKQKTPPKTENFLSKAV